jgi:hypothetical protein
MKAVLSKSSTTAAPINPCFAPSLIALACAVLTACGGGGGGSTDASSTVSSSTTVVAADTTNTSSEDASTNVAQAVDNSAAVALTVSTDTALAAAVSQTADQLLSTPNTNGTPVPAVTADTTVSTAAAEPGNSAVPETSTALAASNSTESTATVGVLRWSDKATWGGVLPTANSEVVIPAGKVILLDTDTPALAGLRIEGTLRFDRRNTNLRAGYINLTGALEIGTAAAPFTQKAVITLDGAPQAVNDGVSRGITVTGGRVEIYGNAPSPVWTKLNDHANAGATSLKVKDTLTNWNAGDTVAVAPTDYYGVAQTERMTLASASGSQAVLNTALSKFRWGKMQFVTNAGMSLTPDASYVPPTPTSPTTLDERAAVANLTRNIVIEGANDASWTTYGFGAHMMIMDLKSKVVVDGVEFRRVGQAGVMGRYPIHWHMLSYSESTGQFLGDATGNIVRNSAIWGSMNRCVVIHGTNGVQVRNNVCEDIKGHAFFLEDAVERRNVIDGNLALMTRAPATANVLQVHETTAANGASGFWLTHPDNTVTNNLGADAEGSGLWLAYPHKTLGKSTAVVMMPDRMAHATFANNTAHSARGAGINLFLAPIDAKGNVTGGTYAPTSDGLEQGSKNLIRFELKRNTSYKNGDGAYRNVAWRPDYVEWTTADNYGVHFAGSVQAGTIVRGLAVGFSLNNLTPYPVKWQNATPAAYATYHSNMDIKDNTAVGFPFIDGATSGVFSLADYYLRPIELGTVRNTGNRIIASNPGFHNPPPNMDGAPLNNRNWTLAGAVWDPNGYWGPKGWYATFDVPYLTYGANCQWVAPAGKNGKSCEGPFYGVASMQTDWDPDNYGFSSPINVVRQDSTGNAIGTWTVGDGKTSSMLPRMRNFVTRPGGRYVLTFPGRPLPKTFMMNVINGYRVGDNFLLAVQFDGTVNAKAYVLQGAQNFRTLPMTNTTTLATQTRYMTSASSLADVTSGTGNRFWQDRANNLVWFKYQVVAPYPTTNLVPGSDDDLYRFYSVVLYSN